MALALVKECEFVAGRTPEPTRAQAREIPVGRNHKAIVDDRDYDYLMHWRWVTSGSTHGSYVAVRSVGGRRKRLMHHDVLCHHQEPYTHVRHVNGNKLDNRYCNLRPAYSSEANRLQLHLAPEAIPRPIKRNLPEQQHIHLVTAANRDGVILRSNFQGLIEIARSEIGDLKSQRLKTAMLLVSAIATAKEKIQQLNALALEFEQVSQELQQILEVMQP